MTRLRGRGVSAGVAVGRAVVAVREARQVRYRLAASGVDRERQRFRTARERTRRELEEISARVAGTVGPAQAAIFAAQLLMLDDPLLAARADELIRLERINADWALERAAAELREVFAREGDVWLRQRAGDVADVCGRLQRNLRPARDPLVQLVNEVEPPVIVVADDLPPSLAGQLEWSRIGGLIFDAGSPTHHTVILARSLGVPTVMGLTGATQLIAPGRLVALDGATGEVAVDPEGASLEEWRQRSAAAVTAAQRGLDEMRSQPARTADGLRIRLEANLEIADEVGRVRDAGADGIGLYRSEFLLDAPPGAAAEESQLATYRALLEALQPMPVTIRTFDAGEDRWAGQSGATGHRERFGLRGIRSSLRQDERFRTQMRALLRASVAGRLRILLPFVTSVTEMRQARALMREEARQLGVSADIPLGAMIEVPAAALTVDHLASEADFLSVGTNDLIQYTLAVDRTDERLAGEYEPCAPGVVRLLSAISVGARRRRCDVSVCGEMAADPVLVALLVGLGFRAFSVSPGAIPAVKRALAALDSRVAERVAREARRAASVQDVTRTLAPIVELMQAPAGVAGQRS